MNMKCATRFLTILLFLFACQKPSSPENDHFDFVFKYGISGERIDSLNTISNTFTRFFCAQAGGGDSTAVFNLTSSEIDAIRTQVLQLDFMNHSDSFQIYTHGDTPEICLTVPTADYYIKVNMEENIKELTFTDNDLCKRWDNDSAKYLGDLVHTIRSVYQSRELYKQLPSHGCVYE
jgi:hypothetical protein